MPTKELSKWLVITIVSMAFTNTAIAADKKVLPGSACTPASSTKPVSYNSSGALVAGANGILVSCPIIRDVTKKKGPKRVEARVSGKKLSGMCFFSYRSASGNASTAMSRAFSGSGLKRVTFTNPKVVDAEGAYNLTCRLNKGDVLHSYQVDE